MNRLHNYARIIAIFLTITIAWQGLEILFYGQVQPNHIDGFVALILAFSLETNLKCFKTLKQVLRELNERGDSDEIS